MFEVKVYRGATLAAGAALALKHRLYISGWVMSGELISMRDDDNGGVISLGFLDDEPVAIVVDDYYQLMAFCRKSLRGNGYASKCLAELNTDGRVANEGIKGSIKFWRMNGIPIHGFRGR